MKMIKYFIQNLQTGEFEKIEQPLEYLPGNKYLVKEYDVSFFQPEPEIAFITWIEVDEEGRRKEKVERYWDEKLTDTQYTLSISEDEKYPPFGRLQRRYYHREEGPAVIYYFRNGEKQREIYKYQGVDYSKKGIFESKYSFFQDSSDEYHPHGTRFEEYFQYGYDNSDQIFRVDYYNYLDFSDFNESEERRYYLDKPLIIVYKNNEEYLKVYGILDIHIKSDKVEYNITPHRLSGESISGGKTIPRFTDDNGYCNFNHGFDILLNKIGTKCVYWNHKRFFESRYSVFGEIFRKDEFYRYKWIWRRCLKRYLRKKRFIKWILRGKTPSEFLKLNTDVISEIREYLIK